MPHHATRRLLVTAAEPDPVEPASGELVAIERELPLIRAEVEELDVHISLLDRPVSELDERRMRRARRKVLATRRALTNRPPGEPGVA